VMNFQLDGEAFELSRAMVEKALSKQTPGRIQVYAVDVQGDVGVHVGAVPRGPLLTRDPVGYATAGRSRCAFRRHHRSGTPTPSGVIS
jgi:hypothetical protein